MNYCALLASGRGTRMGKTYLPKQFMEINGRPLIYYTMKTLVDTAMFEKIFIGISEECILLMNDIIASYFEKEKNIFEIVRGADERMSTFDNIFNLLLSRKLSFSDDDYMCMADANRPLISVKIYRDCMREAIKYGMSCPGHKVIDGTCIVKNNSIIAIPDKRDLYSFQTPECFRINDYINIRISEEQNKCLGIAEKFNAMGFTPHLVESNDKCFKVTTPLDITLFKAYLNEYGQDRDIKINTDAKDISLAWLNSMKDKNKPFVLFGLSGAISYILKTLRDNDIIPKYICDNDKRKINSKIKGIPVISFDELVAKKEDVIIIVTAYKSEYIREIYNQIDEAKFFKDRLFCELFYPIGDTSKKVIAANLDKINMVYMMLEDIRSKMVFENKINYLISKDEILTDEIRDTEQYFDLDVVDMKRDEYFLDVGAFDGQDTLRLMRYSPNLKSVCIEIDSKNCKNIEQRMQYYPNISCVNAGVYDHNDRKEICMTNSRGSSINDDDIVAEKIMTDMIALDDCFINEPVTFIKMDIEGAELKALRGAERIIRERKPKLAICIYHSLEDHWEIPMYIHKLQPDYKLYMRHYHEYGIETVCYAIPKK